MTRLLRPATPMSPREEAALFVLATPLSRAILNQLATRGPLLRSEIADGIPTGLSAVTKPLRDLEDAGLVTGDIPQGLRRGKRVRYSLNKAAIAQAVDAMLVYILDDGDYAVTYRRDAVSGD